MPKTNGSKTSMGDEDQDTAFGCFELKRREQGEGQISCGIYLM